MVKKDAGRLIRHLPARVVITMSLQYIIDAYNLINHPGFEPPRSVNIRQALADFIIFNKLTGSRNNKLVLVFDGYPAAGEEVPYGPNLVCLFSRGKEADESIRKYIEASLSSKNLVVVSDDKEVRLSSRLLRAQVLSVEEFVYGKSAKQAGRQEKNKKGKPPQEDFTLSYSKMQKINDELKQKWLK